jgi:hypothetical protein
MPPQKFSVKLSLHLSLIHINITSHTLFRIESTGLFNLYHTQLMIYRRILIVKKTSWEIVMVSINKNC